MNITYSNFLLPAIFLLGLNICSCDPKIPDDPPVSNSVITIQNNIIVEDSLIGHGAQWGGYDLLPDWTGDTFFSSDDWNKLTERISFMKPGLVRIMIAAGWNYLSEGTFNTNYKPERIIPILNFCQENNITVMFGEWGHSYVNQIYTELDHEWVGYATDYLDWLINDNGFTCIKYYNMVNEPNGNWSSINGNYSLWKSLISEFTDSLENKGLNDMVKVTGPDIAVWNSDYTSWVFNTNMDLNAEIGLYDIHTYPGQTEVRDGTYRNLLKTYKDASPSDKDIIMGELGLKYTQEDGSVYDEDLSRRNEDPYSSSTDGNMLIYDAFYGIDIADAIIQCMLEGYAGSVVWDMDDAMYNNPDYDLGDRYDIKNLKRWGFWNILGDEVFSDGPRGNIDEEIRPWFYPMSLICRYFPAGMKIFDTTLPDKKGLRAVAGEINGKYTVAIINSNYTEYKNVVLKFEDGMQLSQLKKYYFKSLSENLFEGNTNEKGFAMPESENNTLDMSEGQTMDFAPLSFTLYTNINY